MMNESAIAAPLAAKILLLPLLLAARAAVFAAARAACNLVLTIVNALCPTMEMCQPVFAQSKTSSALRSSRGAPSPQRVEKGQYRMEFPFSTDVEKVAEGRMRFLRANKRQETFRDRIALAFPGAYPGGEGENADPKSEASANVAGFAIWASVSEEVDSRIREQIKTGTFPLRLKPEDWTSGDINWLLDVIAPSAKLTSSVLANFGKVVKGGNLRLHPLIARLVDEDTLKKLGAEKMGAEKAGDHQ
jgi:hypothetical protein